MKNIIKKALITGLLLGGFSSSAQSEVYELVDLGTLGGTRSFASAINNNGVVVGTAYDSQNQIHAFSYDGTLQTLTAETKQAFGINDNDQIVGRLTGGAFIYENGIMTRIEADSAYDINNNSQVVGYVRSSSNYAFLYENNVLTNLGILPNSYSSSASAINDNGIIVGNSSGSSFIYQNNQQTAIEVLNGGFNITNDINNNDQIVGYYRNLDNKWDAFVITDGLLSLLDFNDSNTFASAINDSGKIVGWYQSGFSSFDTSAMLIESDGNVVDLNSLETVGAVFERLTRANDINNHGQIVGSGIINGEEHAFLLTPPIEGCEKVHGNTGKEGQKLKKVKKCNGNRAF